MRVFSTIGKARYAVILLVVVSVLFAVGSVFASSGGGHGEGGMDKTKDLIWRTMNFVVLAGGLFFLLRKPVAQGLEARRQGIRDQLDDLENQKAEAAKELGEYKAKLARLDKEIGKIVAEYVKDGEAAKAKIIEEAKGAAEKLQAQAKKNIEHEFQKARQELKAEMSEQAVSMAEALIKKSINDDDQKRIVDEYLTKVVVAQ
ncbi:MAG: F0F1 ATP synthase subunit B [Thermodesulfobacteriota bacterium]|nr:F0F1 ATP synthase subunit B [Thermodesulfobacteriota bacterium]